MNAATTIEAGFSKTSFGVPICTMRPSMNTAMRSAIVIASSWSCVTYDGRHAECALKLAQFDPRFQAQFGVEIRQGLVEQKKLGLPDDRPGERTALLLAAG